MKKSDPVEFLPDTKFIILVASFFIYYMSSLKRKCMIFAITSPLHILFRFHTQFPPSLDGCFRTVLDIIIVFDLLLHG